MKTSINLETLETDTLVIVSDQTVWGLYKDFIQGLLPENKRVIYWISPPGEAGKTFENYERALEHILSQSVHRETHLIAFGGGAVSDFGGFLASTLLRGIPWSVIPTTLLSMADASIGGKVGINSAQGKNLIGSFYLPKNIWIHPDFLKTLGPEQIASGKGEILKYCFLSTEINALVKEGGDLETIVDACARFKKDIVAEDFREQGRRIILNFGHTFGHAFERLLGLPHGIAVALGIRTILRHFSPELMSEYGALTRILGLDQVIPTLVNLDQTACFDLMTKDKKMRNPRFLELVIVDAIGKPKINAVALTTINNILQASGK